MRSKNTRCLLGRVCNFSQFFLRFTFATYLLPVILLTLWASTETQNFVRPHVSTFLSNGTGAIALISIPMERSVHDGVHCENCIVKACHLAKVWRFEWGQVRLELFWRKAGRSWSLEKLWSPFFFELIAKFIDAISRTKSKSLRVAMDIKQRVLWPASPASRPIDWDVEASTNFKQLSWSHF